MKIKILGTGGAINDGLSYNSFLIGDTFLVETPPDIIASLFRYNIDYKLIKNIFISHSHADHCFGFPFLMLRFFFDQRSDVIQVLGPPGLDTHLKLITRLAFGDDHPVNDWVEKQIRFSELAQLETVQTPDLFEIIPFRVFHLVETFSFKIHAGSIFPGNFIYLADSVWDDELLEKLTGRRYLILCDMNVEPDDPVQVHISEYDIIEKVLPFLDPKTQIIGTHLKKEKTSANSRICYAEPGMSIDV